MTRFFHNALAHLTTVAACGRLSRLVASLAVVVLALVAGPALAESADPHAGHAEAAAGETHAAGHGHAEHFTLMSLVLNAEAQASIKHGLAGLAPKTMGGASMETEGHITPVFFAFVAMLIVLIGAAMARSALTADKDAGVLPTRKVGPLLLFEVAIGAVWNMMKGMMGAEEARRHFPIVATCAVYIFTMNSMALLPLGSPATDSLNTNLVMGLTIFFATHISGIRVQGVAGYAKHFAGPILAMAPLMVLIELISHLVRPVSLSLRLMGNMYGDHKVMENFLAFEIPLVPLPVMFLGLMVVVVQTVVFTLLSTVYLSLAVEHHDDHGHDHDHDHGHAHG
jgi:F-type H+-transporting ATPase subunit a